MIQWTWVCCCRRNRESNLHHLFISRFFFSRMTWWSHRISSRDGDSRVLQTEDGSRQHRISCCSINGRRNHSVSLGILCKPNLQFDSTSWCRFFTVLLSCHSCRHYHWFSMSPSDLVLHCLEEWVHEILSAFRLDSHLYCCHAVHLLWIHSGLCNLWFREICRFSTCH